MDQNKIVTISGSDLDDLRKWLNYDRATSVRFAVDDGGLKVSINQGMWTLPLGEVQA